MSDRRLSWLVDFGPGLVLLVVTMIAIGVLSARHWNDGPRPCDDYARRRRSEAPARCFSDFHPETP